MEILVRLSTLLSPSFFAILAGLSLTAAALLFIAAKRNAADTQAKGTKLSELEPTEYRGTGYLVLAFGWSLCGLVLGFIFGAIGTGVFASLIFVTLSLLCLLFTLCFLYAGGGTLLRAATGQKGGLIRWLFPPMWHIDTLILQFGDLLTAGIFGQPWCPRIGGLARAVRKTPAYEKRKAAEEMERLHHEVAGYEARLTPEQREKLVEMRRTIEELMNM